MRAHATGKTALEAARGGKAYRTAAVEFHLSVPMVVWARRILRSGVPALVLAVEEGNVALYMAAEIAWWSAEDQQRFLALALDRSGDRTISARCLAPSAPLLHRNAREREAEAPGAVPPLHGQAAR